jgi:hypothetical protein
MTVHLAAALEGSGVGCPLGCWASFDPVGTLVGRVVVALGVQPLNVAAMIAAATSTILPAERTISV